MATTKRRSLHPPDHRRSDDPYYVDDTLAAYPPYHLLRGKPTPEAMEAAKRLAAERGYAPPVFPTETQDVPASPTDGTRSKRSTQIAATRGKARNK